MLRSILYLLLAVCVGGCAQTEPRLERTSFHVDRSFSLDPSHDFQFVSSSVDGIAHEWRFGDGNFTDEVNPVHSYHEQGEYLVRLRVYGENYTAYHFQKIRIGKYYTTGSAIERVPISEMEVDGYFCPYYFKILKLHIRNPKSATTKSYELWKDVKFEDTAYSIDRLDSQIYVGDTNLVWWSYRYSAWSEYLNAAGYPQSCARENWVSDTMQIPFEEEGSLGFMLEQQGNTEEKSRWRIQTRFALLPPEDQ